MTIRFVKYWNGYSPDAIVHNLGSTEEARLVSLGYATTDLDGPGTPEGELVRTVTGPNGEVSLNGEVSCEFTGASASASASSNYSAIQKALNAGGLVTLNTPGVYLISSTLSIGSNTHLKLGPGVELKASGAGVGNLINSTVMSATKSSVTLTYTANSLLVTVNWTNHGLTTANYVWITGADQYYYLGVFPIVSITDANSFVIKLRRQPTAAATGTIQAVQAQINTKISGGIWNFNYSGGNDGIGTYNAHAIRLGGIANLQMENITGKDTRKYVADVGGVTNFRFNGGYGSGLAADFIKLRGPLFNADVYGIDVSSGDDVLSVQTIEPAAYAGYNWTWGDCIGVRVSGIGGQSATAGIVLYPTNADGFIDGVTINGFTGTMATNPQIRIDNNGTGTGNLGTLTINNPVFSGPNTGLYIMGTVTFGNIVIVNPKHNSVNNQGRMVYLASNTINGNIKVLGGYFSKCESIYNTTAIGGTVRIEFDSPVIADSVWNAINISGAGINYVRLRKAVFLVNPGNAMFNISGASSPTLDVDADHISNPSGLHVAASTGTPTLRTRNIGFQCDNAVFTPVAGSLTYNTNAAFGTGVGVYATGDGASVKLA